MDQPDREAEPHFSQPTLQILQMLIVLGLVGVGVFFALPRVLPVFIANPYLNGFILAVFVIGVLACFRQAFTLVSSVRWIEQFATLGVTSDTKPAPTLLRPLAALLRSRGARMQIAASSSRSILDSVATRIDEAREITRYIINLLIFLGLLGTFYGLATSVPAIVDTISNLSPREGETGGDVFGRLQSGLEEQMGGMGIAFASSLLGLAGSLVVGILELLASHAQNRFYRELEEWLSTISRLGFSSGEGEGGIEGAALAGVVDSMAEQMETLQHLFTQSEVSRSILNDRVSSLSDSMNRIADRMEGGGASASSLDRVVDGQERLIELLANQHGGEGIDAESRMRLRSIDVQMLRILEEMSAGRQESMSELRTDLQALTRVVRQMRKDEVRPLGKIRKKAPPPDPTTGEGG